MNNYRQEVFTRPLQTLLLTAVGTLALSPLSLAVELKVGDAYGGGKAAYILRPGDKDYAQSIDQAVIVAKADATTSLYWSDNRTATDKIDGMGFNDSNLHGYARQAQLTGSITHERNSH